MSHKPMHKWGSMEIAQHSSGAWKHPPKRRKPVRSLYWPLAALVTLSLAVLAAIAL